MVQPFPLQFVRTKYCVKDPSVTHNALTRSLALSYTHKDFYGITYNFYILEYHLCIFIS